MKKGFLLTLSLFACFIVQFSYSQPICGFDEAHARMMNTDPQYKKRVIENEARIQTIIKNQLARKAAQPANARTSGTLATLYTIPVVVHVITTGGAVGTIYNPTDAQITGAINYLNQVYNGTYPGTEGVGDIQIQFALATRGPNCTSTTGIERIDFSSNATYVSNGVNSGSTGSGVNELVVKNLSRWNPSSYYNIWVVDKIDGANGTSGQFIAGYAYFAGASPFYDGTIMLATQMIAGQKTLPHEIGHVLSLYHPFEGSTDVTICPANSSCSTQGDKVCDTDPISENMSSGVLDPTCRTGANACNGGASYSINTEHNYMNYSNCYTLFTAGQRDRMQAAMLLPDRASYINAWSQSATYPLSTFTAPAGTCNVNSTSANPNVGLLDISIDNKTFSSGTSGADNGYVDKTGECTSLIYLQAGGTYTLSASVLGVNQEQVGAWLDYNNDGAYSASENVFPTVDKIPSAGGVYPYPTRSNSFTIPVGAKTGTVLRLRVIEEAATIYTNAVSLTSGCSAPFYGQAEDYPVYIAATTLPITLEYFKGSMLNNVNHLSWRSSNEINTEEFEVERSYNGTSYEPIGTVSASGADGSTYSFDDKTAAGNVVYYRLKEMDYTGPSKFSSVVIIRKGALQETGVTILNNPFRDNFTVSISSPVQSKVAINLMDITGKLLYTRTTEALSSGFITITPDSKEISAGVYLVQVIVNGKTFTKKVIKE